MNVNITASKYEQVKKYIDTFPVLPATVTSLISVTGDPESSAHDVMEVILPDQSLCITVLKIANSVLFGRPKKVDSLRMAVSVLGFNQVQEIALTKAFINSFNKLAKEQRTFFDKHWTHSFLCGMIARRIASDLHCPPDSAFMGGLIHDIGKLIMLETFSDDYSAEHWMTNFSNEEILHEELRVFSFTHDQVGGQLLKKWDFPETLVTAVSNHHRPVEAVTEKSLALIIQLADLLSFRCCNQDSLGDGDIITDVHNFLPDLQGQCKRSSLPLDNDMIAEWFTWLTTNYEEGCSLKEAFSA
jgi:putative nucleotidyltransferase with HDIG domain